jgi:hypothetical protein
MTNDVKRMAQQKRLLITQGAVYRAEIMGCAHRVRTNLHADVLARNAINHLTANATAAVHNLFDFKNFTSGNLRTALPLLVSGVSLISRKKALLKPVLVGAAALAAIATGVYFLGKKKPWRRLRRTKV